MRRHRDLGPYRGFSAILESVGEGPMSSEAPPTDPLRALFSGRREFKRHPVSVAATLAGQEREFEAHCVDASAGGALLAVARDSLERAFENDKDDFLSVIGREFQGGLLLQFVQHGFIIEAEIVRLSLPSGQADTLYLGVSFCEALTATARNQLGMPPPPDHDDGGSDGKN